MAKSSEHGIRLSCMNPAFLNSNSTSHTWPFSAVAELVDNASDPGVCAKQMWIDVVEEEGHLCLTFTDNGCGMTPNKLHKMLSFGFTEKGSSKFSQQAIGVYGNGFKSGSMRLGRDVLIFTKNGGCQSVGMMSQTYLENIKAQAVIVPIVPFNQQTKSQVVTQDSENNLKAILEHSIVTSLEKLHAHFDSIPSKKGTKILIWNIRRTQDGKPEIDFETDVTDFRLPIIHIEDIKKGQSRSGSMPQEQNIPEIQYSLRAYLSILYLKPRTQVVLRGKKTMSTLITKGLNNIEHDVYKPQFSKDKVKVTFGMNPKKKDHYGIMLYHKNRLIKAYEKVGCQLKSSGQRAGGGVIGVIECNFLKPAHNKQDFEYTKEYRLTLSALGIKLNDYWKALTDKQSRGRAFQAGGKGESEEESASDKHPTWLQCEECLKWRSIPPGHYEHVPESWNCSQNPNSRYRSCSAPEEAEEEPSAPSYQKSYKKQEFKKCRKQRSLENCEKDQSDEDETLSQSSSEPTQSILQSPNSSVHSANRKNTKEDTQQAEHTSGDHWEDSKDFPWSTEQTPDHPEDLSLSHTKDRTWASATANMVETMEEHTIEGDTDEDVHEHGTPVTREPTIDGNTHKDEPREDEKSDHGIEDEKEDDWKDTHMESEERKQNTDKTSNKRKPEPLFSSVIKKSCLQKQWAEAETLKEILRMSSEKTKNDRSSRADDDGDALKRDVATQRSGPSPQSGPLSPDKKDQVTNLQRLAELEKEVQKLRSLLGVQVHRTTQGTMTTEGKPKDAPANPSSREIGCQTDVAESSSSSCSLAQISGERAEVGQSALVRSVGEQSEQSRTRRKTESPSWIRSSDGDSRSLQECLHLIRNNVVVLLTALLPQLDLTGISMDTPDVDSILQQIIEVNQLKL